MTPISTLRGVEMVHIRSNTLIRTGCLSECTETAAIDAAGGSAQ
jgi:hypothetical protein